MEPHEVACARPRLQSRAALEHQSHARPQCRTSGPRVLPEHPGRATVRGPVALDDLNGRRLAGPIGPEERHQLARPHGEVHAVEDRSAAIRLAKAGDLDQLPIGGEDPAAEPARTTDPVGAPGRMSAYFCSKRSAVTSPSWIARRIPSPSMKYDRGRTVAR